MASDPLVPRSRASRRGSRFSDFLLRTLRGRLLLALASLAILGAVGIVPSWLDTAANVGLWAYAAGFVLWGILRLRTKLLWRIRRKLVISYLLIGLVPTLLILCFFIASGYFVVGQMSSYMLNGALDRIESESASAAELMLSELRGLARTRSHLADEAIRAVLEERLAAMIDAVSGSGAIYIEHRRGRIQRVVATAALDHPLEVGTLLPPWMEAGYQGPMRMRSANFVGGTSLPNGNDRGRTVVVVSPLELVLERASSAMGFHIDQVLTSVSGEANAPDTFVPSERPLRDSLVPAPAKQPLTLPWIDLLQVRDADNPASDDTVLVFVQFGFSPVALWNSIAASALQLGPEGPDLGPLILVALALLAGLFLLIEVVAIFVGLVLARSITGSVHALSQGTEHVRQGDFGYKVQVRSKDQLGELADSFNLMTSSIQDLMRESAEKERLEEELRIARKIQDSLLPKDRVNVPGLAIEYVCLPATEVGGDYYDFIPLRDGRLALLIADVSGKGTSAALYMAELKGLVLSLSQIFDSPRQLLVEANKILSANLDSRSFITMAYAVLDMKAQRMTYARAGHNPIFQLSPNGAKPTLRVLAPEGLGLALDRGNQFERILKEETLDLRTGDLFLFYTDGVSEAMNTRSELFGDERLQALMRENAELSLEELREKMVDEVFSFAGGAVQHDDMTMVLVKVL